MTIRCELEWKKNIESFWYLYIFITRLNVHSCFLTKHDLLLRPLSSCCSDSLSHIYSSMHPDHTLYSIIYKSITTLVLNRLSEECSTPQLSQFPSVWIKTRWFPSIVWSPIHYCGLLECGYLWKLHTEVGTVRGREAFITWGELPVSFIQSGASIWAQIQTHTGEAAGFWLSCCRCILLYCNKTITSK